MKPGARLSSLAIAAALATALAPGCSLGEGTGTVSGTLDIPGCWSGMFDLKPDFFAAIPTTTLSQGPATSLSNQPGSDAVQLRIQNGGDYESFSDGLAILVDDAGAVRGDPLADGTPRPSLLGKTLVVSLPVGVAAPGVPVTPIPNPAIVHATLYMQKTCRTANVALYAMSAVSLEADGTCNRPASGEAPLPCGAPAQMTAGADAGADSGAGADAGVGAGGVATSTIVFDSLFDGNPDESDAQKRLTNAHFALYLADPREICPGGLGPPPRCRGMLTGSFQFYFERGRPAQDFP
ncbi:MAG: hypothetical protein ACREJ3_02715 [Polyangiaceae bacterium]